MIATEAPASAADSAARWPARPAPMISTSCEGTAIDSIWGTSWVRPGSTPAPARIASPGATGALLGDEIPGTDAGFTAMSTRVAVLGGGTGVAAVLRALRDAPL